MYDRTRERGEFLYFPLFSVLFIEKVKEGARYERVEQSEQLMLDPAVAEVSFSLILFILFFRR